MIRWLLWLIDLLLLLLIIIIIIIKMIILYYMWFLSFFLICLCFFKFKTLAIKLTKSKFISCCEIPNKNFCDSLDSCAARIELYV